MNLKTLIILKFFVVIISISFYLYLSKIIFKNYENFEKQNSALLEQKMYYERILKTDPKDIERRKKLYYFIIKLDSSLKSDNNEC